MVLSPVAVAFVVSVLWRGCPQEEGMKLDSRGLERKGFVDGEEDEVREMC